MSLLRIIVAVVATFAFFMVNTVIVMYLERKVLGHLQSRLGPMRTGFHGVLQPIADAVKVLAKEDLCPARADRILFRLAPIMAFVPAFLVWAAMPWAESFFGLDLDVGVFYVFAVAALFPIGLLVAGWASNNKYSLLGGFRAAAQQVSYEVPMLLSVMGVVMLAGSLGLTSIVDAQSQTWFVFLQPLAFVLYLICILAELNRVPFDMPEAESELVAGFSVEYSGMRFAMFFLAEYANVFTMSVLGALLFLGGWSGPFLPGLAWLLLKAYLIVTFIVMVRGTLPRIRVDQLMAFGWKMLLPMALANVLITGVGIVVGWWALVVLELLALGLLFWLISAVAGSAGGALPADAEVLP